MDPSPYEDNYLVHLYFHYVEKYFFSLPPNTLFPIPKHEGPLFFNFQSIGNGRRKSKQPPSSILGWWKCTRESWSREEGNGDVWRNDTMGGASDKVRRRMEETGDTEPGKKLQWVMGTPRVEAAQGGIQQGHVRSKAPNIPLYFWKESK